jgi:hypothetical protein
MFAAKAFRRMDGTTFFGAVKPFDGKNTSVHLFDNYFWYSMYLRVFCDCDSIFTLHFVGLELFFACSVAGLLRG